MVGTDRFIRQSQLIHGDLKDANALIVGLGMLGSWMAHALVRTAGRVVGFDFDRVAPENLGTQAFHDGHLYEGTIGGPQKGVNKAIALGVSLQGLPFKGISERFTGVETPLKLFAADAHKPLVVVSAVDSFAGRETVARWARQWEASAFIDTRCAGTVGVVLTMGKDAITSYIEHLESDEDAPEPECGTEGTCFAALWVASTVTSSLNRYFKGLPVPYKLVYDVGLGYPITMELEPLGASEEVTMATA